MLRGREPRNRQGVCEEATINRKPLCYAGEASVKSLTDVSLQTVASFRPSVGAYETTISYPSGCEGDPSMRASHLCARIQGGLKRMLRYTEVGNRK